MCKSTIFSALVETKISSSRCPETSFGPTRLISWPFEILLQTCIMSLNTVTRILKPTIVLCSFKHNITTGRYLRQSLNGESARPLFITPLVWSITFEWQPWTKLAYYLAYIQKLTFNSYNVSLYEPHPVKGSGLHRWRRNHKRRWVDWARCLGQYWKLSKWLLQWWLIYVQRFFIPVRF